MNASSHQFSIGHYRPIYIWGGPGTIRMNRLKFMNVQVDEFVHNEVQFQSPVIGRVLSPDGVEDKIYNGTQLDIPLHIYKILLITPSSA